MNIDRTLSPYEWPEYLLYKSLADFTKPEPVGHDPIGARWGIWPLYFEEYRSDPEPSCSEAGPNRIVIWQRVTRTDIPKGWIKFPFAKSTLYIGYHRLATNYFDQWKETARYYRRKWHRDLLNKEYRVVPLSFEQFSAAYAQSTVAKELPTYELKKLSARLAQFPTAVHMWGAQRIHDGAVVGGHAVFDSNDGRASHYSCGFYLAEVRKDRVMLGLMDHWFQDALSRDVEVLHFGAFVAPGVRGTKRGQSISQFKAQFVTDYHLYQPPLVRFVRGTIVR